ncbi:hypothetical protein HMPREF3038_00285 [Akkermansia sp. KLE1797]|nr:hypothetical protein HMPREF3038_00285 [Akkermansia sp. KLE1797]KXU54965.1 hypothetical protein HMPREF3039_00846 [Akkermansia sp. KLE1798]KZA04405.1 hypothetical protein HMPREF1326_01915 [Akkermansia sp. KLE1605]
MVYFALDNNFFHVGNKAADMLSFCISIYNPVFGIDIHAFFSAFTGLSYILPEGLGGPSVKSGFVVWLIFQERSYLPLKPA